MILSFFIKEKWSEFISQAQNPLAVVESEGWRVRALTETESITQGGESGFTGFLARQSDVPVTSFEPDRAQEAAALLRKFSKEQIEYYYFARIIAQWHRMKNRPSVEEFAIWHLEQYKQTLHWDDFDFSIQHMRIIHQTLFGSFGGALDLNNVGWFDLIKNPTQEKNPLREVVQASGEYRDAHIIDGIRNAWKEKKNDVFVVYGSGQEV